MLYGLPRHGKGMGFHRVASYLAGCGIAKDRFSARSVVLTGSNGKGSTAKFITAGLEEMGYSVALFTSPHLVNVNERFYARGHHIDQPTLEVLIDKGLAHSERLRREQDDPLGEFELLFLVACEWFRQQETDFVVWEAGIGGRLDVTRLVGATLSALTSVELEHTALLGNTPEAIACDKLDVVQGGGCVVISDQVSASLQPRLKAYAETRGVDSHFIAEDYTHITTRNRPDGQCYAYRYRQRDISGRLAMLGRHQLSNALCASECIARLSGVPAETVMPCLEHTQWPGRLERISDAPPIWRDVGHTPDAIRLTAETLTEFLPRDKVVVVLGVSEDKDYPAIAAIVQQFFDRFILTRAHKNGCPIERLSPLFEASTVIATTETIVQAVAQARAIARLEQQSVVVLGGLFVAAEFHAVLKGNDPQALEFF